MELDSDTDVQEVLKRLKCDPHDQMLSQSVGDEEEEEEEEERRIVNTRGELKFVL